jgi:hypothetical protein
MTSRIGALVGFGMAPEGAGGMVPEGATGVPSDPGWGTAASEAAGMSTASITCTRELQTGIVLMMVPTFPGNLPVTVTWYMKQTI